MHARSEFAKGYIRGWLLAKAVGLAVIGGVAAIRWLLLVAMLLCVLGSTASAQQYVLRDGYYWSNGKAYKLVNYYDAHLRCYVPRYVLAAVQPSTANYVSPSTPDWRSKLVDIAATAKKYEAAAKASATEHNEFLEAVEALGLNGALATTPYSPRYANGGSLAAQFQSMFATGYSPIAAQGSGVYGYNTGSSAYSVSQATASYPGVDMMQLFQSAASLTQQAQDLGGQANANFVSSINAAGNNAARIQEIRERVNGANALQAGAAALVQAAGAGVPTPSSTTQTSVSIGPTAGQPNAAPMASSGAAFDRYAAVAKAKCVSCHDGSDSPKKGPVLDFQGFASDFSRQDQLLWLDRITTPDSAKRMPAGGSLTAEEIAAFSNLLKSE